MKTKKIIYPLFFIVLLSVSCTKLQETYTGSTSRLDSTSIEPIVAPAYSNLFHLWDQGETTSPATTPSEGGLFPINELSTDEAMIPTRGTDWYDGGEWQQDFLQTWTPNHPHTSQLFIELCQGVSRANGSILALNNFFSTNTVKTYKGELHFLRCYYSYLIMDIYGQVPYRDYTDMNFLNDPKILDRKTAFDLIVNEVKNIALPNMANDGSIPYGRPMKCAAYMLLAKLYLNQEVYTGTPGYDSCLVYVNKVINSGQYSLADDYWQIFAPDNNVNAGNKEIIFAGIQKETFNMGNNGMWNRPFMVAFHYNHKWSATVPAQYNINGAVVPEDFCRMICGTATTPAQTDTSIDMRWRDDRYITNKSNCVYLGHNYGQAYNLSARFQPVKVKERDGKTPVIYTFECPLTGATESNGVRVLKFFPQLNSPTTGESYANDCPIFRIADAYLMRAECNVRLGTSNGAAPVDDINLIRQHRVKAGVSSTALNVTADKVTLDFILNERGLELYQEMHRRQDLIRFGQYLTKPYESTLGQQATNSSPSTHILCPIPQSQIDIIKGFQQNPGY